MHCEDTVLAGLCIAMDSYRPGNLLPVYPMCFLYPGKKDSVSGTWLAKCLFKGKAWY